MHAIFFSLAKIPTGPTSFSASMVKKCIFFSNFLPVLRGGNERDQTAPTCQAVLSPLFVSRLAASGNQGWKINIQKCTQLSSDLLTALPFFHTNAPHSGYLDFIFFWRASARFPSGVFFPEPPELPCCQEVWVPAETPLHLPAALQVHRSDILFSRWQTTAGGERRVPRHHLAKPLFM